MLRCLAGVQPGRYNRESMVGRFLIRWVVCSLGLWLASALLGSGISYAGGLGAVAAAGFILAIINMLIKPIIVILSLPAIVLSLGLFMIIINGVTVYLASRLYAPLHIGSFWAAVFAGMVIGVVNYLVTTIL